MEFAPKTKSRSRNKKLNMVKRASIGADLQHLDADKVIATDPKDHSKRRTLKLVRKANSWGFTLQTYGIKHKKTREVEIMTYVDYVDLGGAAWIAGMRAGDVILSVNGERVDQLSHQELVIRIRQVQDTLRLVVLFEDCCQKVELHERFLKLKAVLRGKYLELKELEMKEMEILENYCKAKGLNRFDLLRQSIISNVSSNSDSWDAYSMVSSPYNLHSTGHMKHGNWSSVSSLKSFSIDDNASSIAEEDCMNYMDSGSDSDSIGLNMSVPVKGRNSIPDLTNTASNSLRVHGITLSSSDSDLYKGKSGKDSSQRRSSGSGRNSVADDEVFTNGAMNDKGDKSEGIISATSFAGKLSKSNGATVKGGKSDIGDINKIYYAGDNGNIIVPKIVVEGDEVFATFDHIDTKMIEDKKLPDIDPSYHDKVVALEIAREMALLENINGVTSEDKPFKNGPFDLDTCSPNSVRKYETSEGQDSSDNTKLLTLFPSVRKTKSLDTKNRPEKLDKSSNLSSKSPMANKTKLSPVLIGKYPGFMSSVPHVCGSLSYDQLKSSVPDFVISFHTEEWQVIYINEKDEDTQL